MFDIEIAKKIKETLLVKALPLPMQERFVELLLEISEQDVTNPGDVLFSIGDTNTDQGCLFTEGALKVTRADGEVRYMESPDILGEVQLFKPQAERTATVEVVMGGPVLLFKWRELGSRAQEVFNKAELTELRETILHSASMREKNILEKPKD